MEDKNITVNKTGVSVFSVLTIILVVAKCAGLINLTWFQCFIPLLIGIGLTVIILIIAVVIAIIDSRM